MDDVGCDHAAVFGKSREADQLLLACGEGGGSSPLCFCRIRIAFLPGAVTRRSIRLNQDPNAEPFRRAKVYVLTRDGIFETRLRSIAELHDRFPDVFVDVNHGIAITLRAITEVRIDSRSKWIMSHLRGGERGAYRRLIYVKVSRRGYTVLRRLLMLPRAFLRRAN